MERPERLGPRGTAFWDAVTRETALDTAGHALLEQACRVLDRLARIDALLAGDETEWATLRQPVGQAATALAVQVDGLLVEARQQQATLRGLLGAMNLGRSAPHAGTPTANAPAPEPATTSGGGDDDDLARRRTRRRRAVAPD